MAHRTPGCPLQHKTPAKSEEASTLQLLTDLTISPPSFPAASFFWFCLNSESCVVCRSSGSGGKSCQRSDCDSPLAQDGGEGNSCFKAVAYPPFPTPLQTG